MWKAGELSSSRIAADIEAGLFYVAECNDKVAGVVKFQLEDLLFWRMCHRSSRLSFIALAVRRQFAGGRVFPTLLQWAVQRTRSLGRRFLRLDCEASRPRLRAVYERLEFQHHSNRQVGPYLVARYEYDVMRLADPARLRGL